MTMSSSNSSTTKEQEQISLKQSTEHLFQKQPKQYHNIFIRYSILIISCFGSIMYCNFLCTSAILYHLKDKISGNEKSQKPDIEQKTHGYIPRKAYDNLSEMKPSRDLQYYLKALNLDLQEFHVTTADGFILTLHRIIDPKETDDQREMRKPVFMQHGLFSSSGNWVVSGKNSLGYYFHEQGYDVWLGNNRSFFRAKHETIKGDLYNSEAYWDWSIEELAYYDLPSMLNTVLVHKKKFKKLILMGHLQGGLQSFMMLKNPYFKPLHEKIELFVPIGPAIYPGPMFYTCDFIKFMHSRSKTSWLLLFGCCAFMRNLCLVRYYIAEYSLYGKLSYYFFKYVFGWYGYNWGQDKKVRHFLFVFVMSYASMELMKYYLSSSSEYGFTVMLQPKESYKNDDHFKVNKVNDSKSFFQFDKTWFTGIKVPMLLFIGEKDHLVDAKKVAEHMRKYEPGYVEGNNFEAVELTNYHHIDVAWAEDVIGSVGYVIIEKLKKMEEKEKIHPEIITEPIENIDSVKVENVELTSSEDDVFVVTKDTLAQEQISDLGYNSKNQQIITVKPLELENIVLPQSVTAN